MLDLDVRGIVIVPKRNLAFRVVQIAVVVVIDVVAARGALVKHGWLLHTTSRGHLRLSALVLVVWVLVGSKQEVRLPQVFAILFSLLA